MPASPCQLSGEWLPNFNHSWFPTASKCFATSLAAGTGQAHRCQDKGWPRQPLPAARATQRAPLTCCQPCQLCAQEVERQLALRIPTEDRGLTSVPQGTFQFPRTSLRGPRSPAFSLMPSHVTRLSWGLISLGKPFRAPSIGQGRPPVSSPVVLVFIGCDGAEPAWEHIQILPFSGSVTPGKSLTALCLQFCTCYTDAQLRGI